jgi:hypothetical protein
VSGQQHAPTALYPRERPGTHCTGGWVGPRASLDNGKSRLTGIRSPDPPARSSVAIPSELPGPTIKYKCCVIYDLLNVLSSRYNSCKLPNWCTFLFPICLFQCSTCFEQPRGHHQENQLYQYNIWYVTLCSFPTCILNGHLQRVTHTRCCIDTIDSPDDEHEVARNVWGIKIKIYVGHFNSSAHCMFSL